MRIRSIKPEFWTSEDIAALDWDTRLIFIGLWSYVDDNGAGRDVEKLILADLFPLEDDSREALARLSRGLRKLEQGGQISRYIVDGKPYLHITAWTDHQKIDHPSKRDRYPLPTCDDASPRPPDDGVSRHPRETVAPGEGEKGNRGEGLSPSPEPAVLALVTADAATASKRPTFDDFWALYPRKVGKDAARAQWDKAVKVKKIDPAVIIAGAQRLAEDPNLPEKQFIPHPATWLTRGGWDDEPYPSPRSQPGGSPYATQGSSAIDPARAEDMRRNPHKYR